MNKICSREKRAREKKKLNSYFFVILLCSEKNIAVHVQLTIINRNMRLCIEISDYNHTCSKIEKKALDQKTDVTLFCLLYIYRSSGGLDGNFKCHKQTGDNKTFHWSKILDQVNLTMKFDFLINQNFALLINTAVAELDKCPFAIWYAQMWRSTVESIEYSSNICLSLFLFSTMLSHSGKSMTFYSFYSSRSFFFLHINRHMPLKNEYKWWLWSSRSE